MAERERGIFRRGRFWWVRYSVNGRMRFESTKSTEKRHAIALLAKRRAEVFEGTHFPEKVVDRTLGEVIDEYIKATATKRDARSIKARLHRAAEHFGRNTPIRSIDLEAIREYQEEISTERTTRTSSGAKRKPATVRQMLANLRTAFRHAIRTRFTSIDPMKGFSLPEVSNTRDRIATDDEIRQLVENADRDLADLILLGVETGLRLERIASIDMEQVDLEKRMLSLEHRPGAKPVAKQVPLSMRAVEVIRSRQKTEGLLFAPTDRFSTNAHDMSVRFGRLTRRLKIKNLRFHDLRHTAFTRLRRAGVDLRTIQAISGHKRLDMLFRYQTVDEIDLLSAIDKVKPTDLDAKSE